MSRQRQDNPSWYFKVSLLQEYLAKKTSQKHISRPVGSAAVSSPTIFRLSFTFAAAASKLLKAISWNHWIRQMIFLKTDRYQKCHEVGVVGRRSSKKRMYELFPFLWPFICYFWLNLSVLEVFGRFLCVVNDGIRLAFCLRNGIANIAFCLRNGIANTGPWGELAKRQNGPNYVYMISGHKVATLS